LDTEFSRFFEKQRGSLTRIAFHMVGNLEQAEDAVQDTWLKANARGVSGIRNRKAWLRKILSRNCLDLLRARSRHALRFADFAEELQYVERSDTPAPEANLVHSEAIESALAIVLNTLRPAERVAFVLHDLFNVPFADVATVLRKSQDASKQLSSRARKRIYGHVPGNGRLHCEDFAVVDAFLAAVKTGDFERLVGLLAPDIERTIDDPALNPEQERITRGAQDVAKQTLSNQKYIEHAVPLLIDGCPGLVVAPRGIIATAVLMEMNDARIASIHVITAHSTLLRLSIALPWRKCQAAAYEANPCLISQPTH